jgi:hypothetical protein
VDEGVGASDKLDEGEVGLDEFVVESESTWMASVAFEELVVGHVGEGMVGVGDAEAEGTAWVVAGAGVDADVAYLEGLAGLELVEVEGALKLVEADGEMVGFEDLAEGFLGVLAVEGGAVDVDDEVGAVEWLKEGEADHVVPVVVADDQVDLAKAGGEQLVAKGADAGAGVDDDLGVRSADLKAGGVAAKAGVVLAGDGDRSSGAPQLEVGVLGRRFGVVDVYV